MEENKKTYWTDNDELVEKYVLGQISAEEKASMDQEIADCEPCKAKLREEMEMAAGIRKYGHDALRSRLRSALNRGHASQFTSSHYIGLAAAVAIVAVGIGIYALFFGDLESPKQFHDQEIVLTPQDDTPESSHDGMMADQDAAEQPAAESSESLKSVQENQSQLTDAGTIPRTSPSAASSGSGAVLSDNTMAASEQSELSSSESSGSSSIWLIGQVVMIREQKVERSAPAARTERLSRQDVPAAKEKMTERTSSDQIRLAKDEGIVLLQQDIVGLPPELTGLAKKSSNRLAVHTLLERTDTGMTVTLFGDAVSSSDLNKAVVETFTNDSLVVVLPHQRIAFRMPAGWGRESLRSK